MLPDQNIIYNPLTKFNQNLNCIKMNITFIIDLLAINSM